MNSKYVGLMPFEPKLSGEAKEIVGSYSLKKFDGELPKVADGLVVGMPEEKTGTIYVVNAIVFNAILGKRDDVVMFDPEKAVRFEEGKMAGKVKSQGGFINP